MQKRLYSLITLAELRILSTLAALMRLVTLTNHPFFTGETHLFIYDRLNICSMRKISVK